MSTDTGTRRPYRWISSTLVLFIAFFVVDLLFKQTVTRSLLSALVCTIAVQLVGRLVDRTTTRP